MFDLFTHPHTLTLTHTHTHTHTHSLTHTHSHTHTHTHTHTQTASNYQEEVRVFKKFHGNIIGKGGNTLRKVSSRVGERNGRGEREGMRTDK